MTRPILGILTGLLLAGITAGCGSKTDSADTAAPPARSATATAVPANAPPKAAQAIQASQQMGSAMQQRANQMGAGMAKAKRP